MSVDRCVCCGAEVPEGQMVCKMCEAGAKAPIKHNDGLVNRDDVRKAILDEFDGDIRYTMSIDEFISDVLRVVDSVEAADEVEIANAYFAVPDSKKPVAVVMCGECKHQEICSVPWSYDDTFFCRDGERKEVSK